MPRSRIRSGVRSSISFLTRQIAVAKKTIADCKTHIAQLKRADKRVRRLGSASAKKLALAKTTRPKLKATDLAFQIMSARKKPVSIIRLAELVGARSKRKLGVAFKQNLGAALNRDKRFRRVSRGVYGLRRRPTTKKK